MNLVLLLYFLSYIYVSTIMLFLTLELKSNLFIMKNKLATLLSAFA